MLPAEATPEPHLPAPILLLADIAAAIWAVDEAIPGRFVCSLLSVLVMMCILRGQILLAYACVADVRI